MSYDAYRSAHSYVAPGVGGVEERPRRRGKSKIIGTNSTNSQYTHLAEKIVRFSQNSDWIRGHELGQGAFTRNSNVTETIRERFNLRSIR